MHSHNTKIIATVGPTLKEGNNLKKILELGVDVLRFNFSHLNPEQAEKDFRWVEKVAAQQNKVPAFLADLKGPEIRLLPEDHDLDEKEKLFLIYHDPKKSLPDSVHASKKDKNGKKILKIIKMDHPKLHTIIKPKQIIDADDGQLQFKVIEVSGKRILCEVVVGGYLKGKKSLHLSKVDLKLPILSEQDSENLKVIVKKKFSWIAASFVNRKEDILEIKKKVQALGGDIPIIAKIESYLAVKNIDEIVEVSEGIMVARGDLGQEFKYEEIPELQNMIVGKAKSKGKVCIIATQLLNGMIESPTPTRAEVTDINLAVRNKVDALMLSAETAAGKYPTKVIEVLHRVIKNTEENLNRQSNYLLADYTRQEHFLYALCRSALQLTRSSKAKCLLIITEKGRGPVFVSAFRPAELTVVVTQNLDLYRRCQLYYSIHPVYLEHVGDKISYLRKCELWLKKKKFLSKGDRVVSIYSERLSKTNRIDHITQQIVQ